MNPIDIIEKYYEPGSKTYNLLVEHSRQVADKAHRIAGNSHRHDLDIRFIEEAAMLHDIGIFLTDAPGLGCHDERPYICHGFLGHDLLKKSGSDSWQQNPF